MLQNKLFVIQFPLIVGIGVFHLVALELNWYWLFPWADVLMHFLGGLWISFIVLWFFFESGYLRCVATKKNTFVITAISIFLVAISWEIFELLAGVPIEANFVSDTVVDLVMGVLGAFTGWVYYNEAFLK